MSGEFLFSTTYKLKNNWNLASRDDIYIFPGVQNVHKLYIVISHLLFLRRYLASSILSLVILIYHETRYQIDNWWPEPFSDIALQFWGIFYFNFKSPSTTITIQHLVCIPLLCCKIIVQKFQKREKTIFYIHSIYSNPLLNDFLSNMKVRNMN